MQPKKFLAILAAALGGATAQADVKLASPFTDHLVFQQGQPVPVWGWADPGEEVTVSFAGQKRTAVAAADGAWKIELDSLAVSADPLELAVAGKNTITLHDILVGEVWLASGQSNMDFTVQKTEKYYFAGVINEAEEIAAAKHPKIRMFTGAWKKSYAPEKAVSGTWKVCSPETVGEFSAIGYFFARALHRELNVPVGIVTLTYGASTAQAWIRREAIAADPRLKPALDEFDAKVKTFTPSSPDEMKKYEEAVAKAKAEKQRRPRNPNPDPVQDQHNPTVMFNGMIAPFVGYGIRGVIWYQGESITGAKDLFPVWNETLIGDWRKLWGRELPFYFCQLAALNAASNGPEVRELQAEALKLPATGMAVTIDVGDPKDVHPHNKAPVGERLMRIALAQVYGRKIEFSGPVLETSVVDMDALRLKFSHANGGLVAKDGPLKTFEIAGADGKFVPAEATIEGDTVTVRSPEVSKPVAARYAWSPYPEGCNFYNAAGLPAAPFRTDKK